MLIAHACAGRIEPFQFDRSDAFTDADDTESRNISPHITVNGEAETMQDLKSTSTLCWLRR